MRTLKNIVLLLIFSLCSQLLLAQTRPGSMKGMVTDAATGEVLPIANVVLKNSIGNIIAGGTTDFDGKYDINPIAPGTYDIEVSFTGYATVKLSGAIISPNNVTVQDFRLSEASDILSEVVVRYEKPLIRKGRSGRVYTREDLNSDYTRGSGRVKKPRAIVTQVPGVTSDEKVNIRGARTEGTIFIVDGVKIRGGANIPQAAIQSSEVITGGLPAQYGDTSSLGLRVIPEQRGTSQRITRYIPPQPPVYENYAPVEEIPFRFTTFRPLSTFSSDVDVASYSNVRRFLTDGYLPPVDAVRIEEMINYFTYDYNQPEAGEVFSINSELGSCPWNEKHRLLRVGINTADVPMEDLPDNNLVFLIDVSGSMGDADKLPLLKKSLKLLVENLDERDKVSIVVYASASGLVLPPTPGNKKGEIINAINNLSAGGSTAGGAGIKLAYKKAKENFDAEANNRVILATDGDFNVGVSSESELIKLIEEKREDGIFLTVLGFGTGNLQDAKMEQIADHGNGNYAYIDNLLEAQKVLVNEMGSTLHAVAKDTKFQIEFNPQNVKAYRLIGYENRQLNDEDFNDDTKDAGDVGSGHSVTAVFEIIPLRTKTKDLPQVDDLKYQTSQAVDEFSGELATVKIRYKQPDGDKSVLRTSVVNATVSKSLSPDFSFVCAIMQMGMILRNSEYKGASSYESALALAKIGKGDDANGYRGEFIRLIKLAKDLDHREFVGVR